MAELPHRGPLTRLRRSEAVQLGAALVAGVLLATILLGGLGSDERWRIVVLPVALLLVTRALIALAGIARAEWRRDRTGLRAYVGVVARFAIAYVIVALASS